METQAGNPPYFITRYHQLEEPDASEPTPAPEWGFRRLAPRSGGGAAELRSGAAYPWLAELIPCHPTLSWQPADRLQAGLSPAIGFAGCSKPVLLRFCLEIGLDP